MTLVPNLTFGNNTTPLTGDANSDEERGSLVIDSAHGTEYVTDEVIVRYNYKKFQNPAMMSIAADQNTKIGGKVTKDFTNIGLPGMQVVKLPKNLSVDEAIIEYQKNPDVLYAEPNYVYHINVRTPSDSFFSQLWGLHNTGQMVNGVTGISGADINAMAAWDITTGSNNVVVAIVEHRSVVRSYRSLGKYLDKSR